MWAIYFVSLPYQRSLLQCYVNYKILSAIAPQSTPCLSHKFHATEKLIPNRE